MSDSDDGYHHIYDDGYHHIYVDGYHHIYDDDDLLGYELSSCHSVALHG